MKAIKITGKQAIKIIEDQMKKEKKDVVACYKGQWYDVRHLTAKELLEFKSELVGIAIEDIPKKSINTDL